MEKSIGFGELTMGVCYYPEHWDESLWADDLRRMLDAGIRVIRIAEFAWNKFEPEESHFTFAFFDAFLSVVHQTDMKVIFGTPTATPPAWASENYPEILNATKDGVLYRHGERRHYNYNSPKYIELTEKIVGQLARHYGHDESIIGWQIDNELNCHLDEFYSESDTLAFRAFLQKKYGTLDALNRAWGAVFWNQDYTNWSQVHLPRKTSDDSTNPHEMLDYYRFVSDSACRYAALQSVLLRRHIDARQFVTTNGLFGNIDYNRMAGESLDFITYDAYPNFGHALDSDPGGSAGMRDRITSRGLTETRAISPNFGIMEQQSGAGGWVTLMEQPMPKPGQMTLWVMQSIAHGADYIGFFRWRTCTFGTEIYWHGILDYTGKDNRRLAEVKDIHAKMERLKDIAGAKYVASFAVVKEYDNVWDAQYDAWHRRAERVSEQGWFEASLRTHTPANSSSFA